MVFDSRMNLVTRFPRVPSALVVLALLVAVCAYGQVTPEKAKRTFTHDRDIETYSVWNNFPRWGGEIFAGYENNFSNGPIIYTIDRNGKRDETLFTFEDAGRINLYNIAVSRDGEIALVGSAYTNDGKGTTFIARIAPDRQRQTITRTWPYCPGVVTFLPRWFYLDHRKHEGL